MKYPVLEIYEMRRLTEELCIAYQWSHGNFAHCPSSREVEEQLLTYMANETTPCELREELERLRAERSARA